VCNAFTDTGTVGDWDDFDWGWKEDVQEVENEETELQCWLQECHISMSPVGDLIAVASADRIVHFTREYGIVIQRAVFASRQPKISHIHVFKNLLRSQVPADM